MKECILDRKKRVGARGILFRRTWKGEENEGGRKSRMRRAEENIYSDERMKEERDADEEE